MILTRGGSRRAVRGWWLVFAVAVVSCVVTHEAPARAEPAAGADAKELYKRANALFQLGKYGEAAKVFEDVFELRPDQAVLLYNIAQAYRLAGQNEKALFFYKGFLKKNPDAPNQGEVGIRIAELERAIAEQKRGPNEPVPAPLADVPPRKRTGRDKPVKPVVVAKAPPVEVRPVAPPPVAQVPVEPTPPPVAVAPEPAPTDTQPATPVYKKWWLWAGVAGVVVVAAVVVGVLAAGSGGNNFSSSLGDFGPGTGALVRF